MILPSSSIFIRLPMRSDPVGGFFRAASGHKDKKQKNLTEAVVKRLSGKSSGSYAGYFSPTLALCPSFVRPARWEKLRQSVHHSAFQECPTTNVSYERFPKLRLISQTVFHTCCLRAFSGLCLARQVPYKTVSRKSTYPTIE